MTGRPPPVTADEDLGDELVSWHWHPNSRRDPHLHVYGQHEASGPLGKLHLPTGRVSFEAVVRCLILDWGVTPARDD